MKADLTSAAPAPTVPRARRWAAALLALPPAYAGLAVLLVLAAVMRPQLLSAMLLPLIARQAAPLGLAVIGQSLVMRGRSIDLSSGGVIVAVSYLLTSGYFPISDAVAMGACVALGLLVGVVNGALIVKARASSMIVTLATSMILTRSALLASNEVRNDQLFAYCLLKVTPKASYLLRLSLPVICTMRSTVWPDSVRGTE